MSKHLQLNRPYVNAINGRTFTPSRVSELKCKTYTSQVYFGKYEGKDAEVMCFGDILMEKVVVTRPRPNVVRVEVADGVGVEYDRQFNAVEVRQGKKVLCCSIVRDGYSLREFLSYAEKVREVFEP